MYRKFDVAEIFFFWNSTFLVELNTANGIMRSHPNLRPTE
jgi:hypothetical protein